MMTSYCKTCSGYDELSARAPDILWRMSTDPVGTARLSRGVHGDCVYQVCECGRWCYLNHSKLFAAIDFDRGSTEPAHVREAYRKLRDMFPQVVADFVRDEIKQMVWENVQEVKRFVWERDLPRDVVLWASQLISDEVHDSCKDNCRVANKAIPRQVRQYRKAQGRGCCGRFDTEADHNGEVYLIGCNYGH